MCSRLKQQFQEMTIYFSFLIWSTLSHPSPPHPSHLMLPPPYLLFWGHLLRRGVWSLSAQTCAPGQALGRGGWGAALTDSRVQHVQDEVERGPSATSGVFPRRGRQALDRERDRWCGAKPSALLAPTSPGLCLLAFGLGLAICILNLLPPTHAWGGSPSEWWPGWSPWGRSRPGWAGPSGGGHPGPDPRPRRPSSGRRTHSCSFS